MSGHDLNDVYNRLGKLEASTDEVLRQLRALFVKLDQQRKDMHEIGGVAKEAVRQANQNKDAIANELRPVVDDYKALKNRGLGVIAVVGLIGSGAGIVAAKMYDKFLT